MHIIVNDQPQQVDDGISVDDLLGMLNLAGRPVAVELNRQVVPRAMHAERRLGEGDRVEIVTLVGGG